MRVITDPTADPPAQERQRLGIVEAMRIPPVLGVQTGLGIIGTAVVPQELMEGLDSS